MSDFGQSIATAQVTTGNPATVNDAYDTTKFNNGARNPLGRKYYSTVTSASNPSGYPVAYRYVRYNPTTPPTLHASGTSQNVPGLCYWKDETFTQVTPVQAEALGGAIAGVNAAAFAAGILLNGSMTSGNYCFIQVFGLLPNCVVPANVTIGDQMIGSSATSLAFTRFAAASTSSLKVAAFGASASSGTPNLGDAWVVIEQG
jgi:hypothetical protein